MKTLRIATAALVLASAPALADSWGELPFPPTKERSQCPPGQAFTYVVQCDHGTRTEVDRYMGNGAGVEVCRVGAAPPTCAVIQNASPDARRGYEVQDSSGGDLVTVTFGLEDLLAIQRREQRGRAR